MSNVRINSNKHKGNTSYPLESSHQDEYEDDDDDSENWNDANDEFIDDVEFIKHDSKQANKNTSSSSSNLPQAQATIKTTTSNCDIDLTLHEAIFKGNIPKIFDILIDKELSESIVNKKDKHGNTPLHLACMMGRPKEVVAALLKRGASVECKNLNRWTPFHEACSYGNREIITIMTLQLGNNFYQSLNQDKLAKQLSKTRNYRVVLKWEFKSWVPFLTRVLPNDVCVINKQGGNIRIDTRLLELGSEMMSWKKSDGCLIYSSELQKKWVIMNNKTKKYQFISFSDSGLNKHIEYKVDDFMSNDIMDIELESSELLVTRLTSGWIWKADKQEKIGTYEAALYDFNNVYLVTKKRREHLNEEDLKRNKMFNKSAMDMLRFGKKPNSNDSDETDNEDNEDLLENDGDNEADETETHRKSLVPPPPTKVTWSEYCESEPGKYPNLGREQKIKINKTPFRAGVAMSDKFPITKNEFVDLLSIIPLKMFKKLKDFIDMRLPDGFPIRVDIPILPFLSARITFEDFQFLDGPMNDSLFNIPEDYEEETEPMLPIFHKRTKETTTKTQ